MAVESQKVNLRFRREDDPLFCLCGWVVQEDGIGNGCYPCGWFLTTEDRDYFLDKLTGIYPEVVAEIDCVLLVLLLTSAPGTEAYETAQAYLESSLDTQVSMNVHRTDLIHQYAWTLLRGSTSAGYNIALNEVEARKLLNAKH